MNTLSAKQLMDFAIKSNTINLDITLKQLITSKAFESIASMDDPWDLICYKHYMYIRNTGILEQISVINVKLADSLMETLRLSESLNKKLLAGK